VSSCNVFADHLRLPPVAPQADNWTCGQNTATRVLQYSGVDVTLEQVLASCPKSIDLEYIVAGPTPAQLAACMNLWIDQPQFELRSDLSLLDVMAEISSDRPVILLIRTRPISKSFVWLGARVVARLFGYGGLAQVINESSFARQYQVSFQSSELPFTIQTSGVHYIVINGWNWGVDAQGQKRVEFTYVESLDGREYKISHSNLQRRWDWQETSPFFKKIFDAMHVHGRMMIRVKPKAEGLRRDGVFRRLSPKL
jgi:hypothetical protein